MHSERYLLDIIKKTRFDARLNCFKANNFDDIPEYFLVKYAIKYSCKPREQGANTNEEVILLDSSKICDSLLKILKENDNSHSKLDDSFYLKTIYESVGKAATFKQLSLCLQELRRCLKLEKIVPSFNNARAVGAIKGFGYLHISKAIEFGSTVPKELENRLKEIDNLIEQFEINVQTKAVIQSIYNMNVKNIFYSHSSNISEALEVCLAKASSLLTHGLINHALVYLSEISMRLYKVKKKKNKMNEGIDITERCLDNLWSFISHPIGNLSITFLQELKQIYWF